MATQAEQRTEQDSLGTISVDNDKLWGAQTERARHHFAIGNPDSERMPLAVIHALAQIKHAAANANHSLQPELLNKKQCDLICQAANEVSSGQWDSHFPLPVWISGSGTQCNMNVNEVIANRTSQLAGEPLGSKYPVHPNDHVNLSQSTNDVFPSAMHIAAVSSVNITLMPELCALRDALHSKAQQWHSVIKLGRTHMQDAVPLTLGQEMSGYVEMLDQHIPRLKAAVAGLYPLALGGTAVGTGLNAPADFARQACELLALSSGLPFVSAENKYAVMGAHDALVSLSSAVKNLAVSLHKIANDLRLLASGPRAGLGELSLPTNEPGSSIMPGKVNPTQCEAMSMITLQVMGLDHSVSLGGAGGMLEMNAYKPLLIHNLLRSVLLLGDACRCFTDNQIRDMQANEQKIASDINQSLMLVTALSPHVGYDKAAEIAHLAYEKQLTLREATLKLGYLSGEAFDQYTDPRRMLGPTD